MVCPPVVYAYLCTALNELVNTRGWTALNYLQTNNNFGVVGLRSLRHGFETSNWLKDLIGLTTKFIYSLKISGRRHKMNTTTWTVIQSQYLGMGNGIRLGEGEDLKQGRKAVSLMPPARRGGQTTR